MEGTQNTVEVMPENEVVVSSDGTVNIEVENLGWDCDCPDVGFRGDGL